MTHDPLRALIRSLGQLGDANGAAVSDGELLERFVRRRDQAAFELLVWRHGPMVLGVCRRLLSDAHDAEDAFQTTFLVLVRKAASVRRGETLGGWLYQVAYRVGLRLGASRARRAAREQPGVETLATPEAQPQELGAVLDDEINRLPARLRLAFVLCCLEGKTGAEAAHLLGCPPGTVSSRLTRARERLRQRLRRRGIVVSAGASGLGLTTATLAAVPPPLLSATVAAAGGATSARILSHVEGVLRTMLLTKLKKTACLVTVLGLLLTGGIFAGQALFAQQPAVDDAQHPPPAPLIGPGAGKGQAAAPIVVTVAKPQPGALPHAARGSCVATAFDRADVGAAVSGVLRAVHVDLGARVKRGDLLAELDAPQLSLDVDLAKNAVRQAQDLVAEAEAGIVIARAEAELAKGTVSQSLTELAGSRTVADEAKARWERTKELHVAGAIDEATLSAARAAAAKGSAEVQSKEAAITIAKAAVTVKEGKLAQAEAVRRTAQGKVEAAEVGLSKARLALEQTRIYSPLDGVVTKRYHGIGQVIRVGEGGPVPIATVERTDPVRVVVDVPARDAAAIQVGARAFLSFPALPNGTYGQLKVARTGFAIEPKTQTMRVEIDVANPEQRLRPGLTGTVTIPLPADPNDRTLRIPDSAVVWTGSAPGVGRMPGGPARGGEPVVYVVRGGKAHRVSVQIGESAGEEIEVLSGVRADDLVVTNPEVLQGAAVPVEIKTAPAAK